MRRERHAARVTSAVSGDMYPQAGGTRPASTSRDSLPDLAIVHGFMFDPGQLGL
jgi:hypothetical protein